MYIVLQTTDPNHFGGTAGRRLGSKFLINLRILPYREKGIDVLELLDGHTGDSVRLRGQNEAEAPGTKEYWTRNYFIFQERPPRPVFACFFHCFQY